MDAERDSDAPVRHWQSRWGRVSAGNHDPGGRRGWAPPGLLTRRRPGCGTDRADWPLTGRLQAHPEAQAPADSVRPAAGPGPRVRIRVGRRRPARRGETDRTRRSPCSARALAAACTDRPELRAPAPGPGPAAAAIAALGLVSDIEAKIRDHQCTGPGPPGPLNSVSSINRPGVEPPVTVFVAAEISPGSGADSSA